MFSHMARGLNARGITVAVAGYDLCPIVTIADIIEQMRRACLFLWQRLDRPMFVIGHSAGGHLAAAMVGTDWPSLYPKAPADLAPAGYAISGLYDLTPLLGVSANQDLRLTAEDARKVSPAFWPLPPRPHFGCGGRRAGIERVQAPEPSHRAGLARRGARRATRRSPAPTISP